MTIRSLCTLLGATLLLSAAACTANPFGPTTDTISSTTGKTWWNEDGLLRSELKPAAFVTFNQENLRRDMAAGRGEYLASMSELLGVPADRQPAFFSAVQQRAAEESDATWSKPDLFLAALEQTAHPYLP